MSNSLFEEVTSLQTDKYESDAEEHYAQISQLHVQNYNYYESNENFFGQTQLKFYVIVRKFQQKSQKNWDNFKNYEASYKFGNLITNEQQFSQIRISEFYKIPSDLKLASWFNSYCVEELSKHRDHLNNYAMRLYRNRVNETVKTDRKKLYKLIETKIEEIQKIYSDNTKLEPPLVLISELQHYIEELQYFDRIIPEISHLVMLKIQDIAQLIVKNYELFSIKCTQTINDIY